MRVKLFVLCTGLVLTSAVTAAMAQTAPIYNRNTNGISYTNQSGPATIYNNGSNVPPIALQQMIAGKNAPSYSYGAGGPKPYNMNSNPMTNMASIGSMSPEQASYMRAQQAQIDQTYADQQARLAQQQQTNSSAYQGGSFSQLYNSPFGNKPDTVATKRRVVYKEANNPLITPPRLFNPEQ